MKIETQIGAVRRSKIDLEKEQARTTNAVLKMECAERIYALSEAEKSLTFLKQLQDFVRNGID